MCAYVFIVYNNIKNPATNHTDGCHTTGVDFKKFFLKYLANIGLKGQKPAANCGGFLIFCIVLKALLLNQLSIPPHQTGAPRGYGGSLRGAKQKRASLLLWEKLQSPSPP